MRRLIDKYRDEKELFIKKHPSIARTRNKILWVSYHLQRGKGFWASYIDFGKYFLYLIVAFASIEVLLGGLGIPGWVLMGFSVVVVFLIIIGCIVWSQVMDIIKWTEAESEYAIERNWLFTEIRKALREILGEFKYRKISEDRKKAGR